MTGETTTDQYIEHPSLTEERSHNPVWVQHRRTKRLIEDEAMKYNKDVEDWITKDV